MSECRHKNNPDGCPVCLAGKLDEAEVQLAAITEENHRLKAELNQARARVASLETEFAHERGLADGLRDDLSETEVELERMKAHAALMQESAKQHGDNERNALKRMEMAQAELEKAKADFAEWQRQGTENALAEVDALHAELEKVKAELMEAGAHLESGMNNYKKACAENTRLRSALEESEQQAWGYRQALGAIRDTGFATSRSKQTEFQKTIESLALNGLSPKSPTPAPDPEAAFRHRKRLEAMTKAGDFYKNRDGVMDSAPTPGEAKQCAQCGYLCVPPVCTKCGTPTTPNPMIEGSGVTVNPSRLTRRYCGRVGAIGTQADGSKCGECGVSWTSHELRPSPPEKCKSCFGSGIIENHDGTAVACGLCIPHEEVKEQCRSSMAYFMTTESAPPVFGEEVKGEKECIHGFAEAHTVWQPQGYGPDVYCLGPSAPTTSKGAKDE